MKQTKKELLKDFTRSIISPADANKAQIASTAVDNLFNGLYVNNKYSLFTLSGSTTSSVEEIFLPKNAIIRDVVAVCKNPIIGMTGSIQVELYIDPNADDYDNTGEIEGAPSFYMLFNNTGQMGDVSGSDGPNGSGTIALVNPGTGSMTNFVEDQPTDGWFAKPLEEMSTNFAGSDNLPHGYMLEDTTIKAAFHLIEDNELLPSGAAINDKGQIDVYISYLDLF